MATDSSLPSSAILVVPPDVVGEPGRMRRASHHPTDVDFHGTRIELCIVELYTGSSQLEFRCASIHAVTVQ